MKWSVHFGLGALLALGSAQVIDFGDMNQYKARVVSITQIRAHFLLFRSLRDIAHCPEVVFRDAQRHN